MNSRSLTIRVPPLVHSLYNNKIGDQGASALAAVLKETKICNLKYAAAPRVFAFVSTPADKKANTLQQPTSLTSPDMPSLCFSYHCRVPW